jgi:hypothetical protein
VDFRCSAFGGILAAGGTRAMRTKTGTSYRLSESTLRLIDLLAENTGLSKTGVIEQAVRLMAKREGISIKKEEATS